VETNFNLKARLAKKKMDEFVYLTVPLVVTYAPMFETVADTRLKLEVWLSTF